MRGLNHTPKMYSSVCKEGELWAGDILRIPVEEFKEILQHECMNTFLGQFKIDKSTKRKWPEYWVLLNKPCDMVFNKSRKFTTNLILCPVQGLKENIRSGYFKKIRTQNPEACQPPSLFFKTSLKNFLNSQINKSFPKKEGETNAEYGQRRKVQINTVMNKIHEEILKSLDDEWDISIFEASISRFSEKEMSGHPYFDNILNSKDWESYKQKLKETQEKDLILHFKANSSELANLALNQLDSRGIFFLEPHTELATEDYDCAFLIEFEDILTLKIKPEHQESGFINKFLEKKRKLCLEPLFSARLQNMMSVFFSKVGTPDVFITDVIRLYKENPSTYGKNVVIEEEKEGIPIQSILEDILHKNYPEIKEDILKKLKDEIEKNKN